MLNHDDALVKIATDKYEQAAADLQKACKRYRKNAHSALAGIYAEEMDEAFKALEKASDDLREVRDGYRYTYPHPAALAPHGNRYPVR